MLMKESLLLVVLGTLCYLAGGAKGNCPGGWTKRGNKCYKFDGRKLEYNQAKSACRQAGGFLAMPKTQREINDVVGIRNSRGSRSFLWIGLTDKRTEGHWVWNDGTSLNGGKGSRFWRKNQPDNSYTPQGENCGHIWEHDKFNDVRCNYRQNAFVCQKVAPKPPTTTTRAPTTTPAGPVIMLARRNGNLNFNRNWGAYKQGFGNCQSGDCWLGLNKLHKLCSKNCKLEVRMKYKGRNYHADYTTFRIGAITDNFRMTIGGHSGNAYDNLAINNGMQFSTKDRDNDKWRNHCAKTFTGGWWYTKCHHAHPTGTWGSRKMGKGIVWKSLTGQGNSLSFITMTVTPY